MSDPTTSPIIDDWMKVMLVIFVIVAVFEVTLLAVAYFNADEIECNWLWCSFKTTRGSSIITEDCFQNGIRINCSGMHELENITGWFND